MQLQEMKRLVEYEALSGLMAVNHSGGWVLIAIKNENDNPTIDSSALCLARSSKLRVFKTLDAVNKLVKKELYNSSFTIC